FTATTQILLQIPSVKMAASGHINYFFYNKKLKRIVFFTCRAINPSYPLDSGIGSDFALDEDEDMY
ncbi:unnamed protein product, partial [Timema podura]|nr:unnamed protein product [Timema podura]